MPLCRLLAGDVAVDHGTYLQPVYLYLSFKQRSDIAAETDTDLMVISEKAIYITRSLGKYQVVNSTVARLL